MKNFLDKAIQKELKNRYAVDMMAYWKEKTIKDRMTKYCLSSSVIYVPICDGKYIIPIEKGGIETDFYFGYSDCGQGLSYDENNQRTNKVQKSKTSYFIEKNLEDINRVIKHLQDAIENTKKYGSALNIYHAPHYYGMSNNVTTHYYTICDMYYNRPEKHFIEMSLEDAENLLKGYKAAKVLREQRLERYLNRFGTKHMSINTYWIDR